MKKGKGQLSKTVLKRCILVVIFLLLMTDELPAFAKKKHEHVYTETIITKATCHEYGEKKYTCKCGDSYTESYLDPDNHYYCLLDEWIVHPTCMSEGLLTRRCSFHPEQKRLEVVPIDKSNHVGIEGIRTPDNQGIVYLDETYHGRTVLCACGDWYIEAIYYHSNNTSYGQHTSSGHFLTYSCGCGYHGCRNNVKQPGCAYCETAPTISFISPTNGSYLNMRSLSNQLCAFLRDVNGDRIRYNLYLDDSNSPFESGSSVSSENGVTVQFNEKIPVNGLSEGTHILRVTAIDPMAPSGEGQVTFIYDNTKPEVTATEIIGGVNDFEITTVVKDALSDELEFKVALVMADEFNIKDGESEDSALWNDNINKVLAGTDSAKGTHDNSRTDAGYFSYTKTFSNIEPATEYIFIISAKDKAGNETRYIERRETEGKEPKIHVVPHADCCADIYIEDGISSCRGYVVRAMMEGNLFLVSPNGSFMYIPAPSAIPNLQDVTHCLYGDESGQKCISVRGFAYGKEYTVSVGRIKSDGIIVYSEDVVIICDRNPLAANELTAPAVTGEASEGSITLAWNKVPGATAYDVEIDGKIYTVGNSTSYTQRGLDPESTYEYRVRGRNSIVKGAFSEYVIMTVPGSGDEEIQAEETDPQEGQETDETPAHEKPQTPCISIIKTGRTYVKLSWQPDVNTEYYGIIVNGNVWRTVRDCMITVDGLTPDTDYEITVIPHGYEDAECAAPVDPAPSEFTEISDITETAEVVCAGVLVHTASEPVKGSVTERRTIVTAAAPFVATAGKTYRVAVPVKNVKGNSRYSLELIFDEADVELTDLYEPTPEKETEDTAPEGTGLTFTVRNEGGKTIIAAVWETTADAESAYIMDVLVKSRKTGVIGYEYR